jgi:hypothetical protein
MAVHNDLLWLRVGKRGAIRKRYENYANILLARKSSLGYHAAHSSITLGKTRVTA